MSRVLVVDDDSGIRRVVRDAFERAGHEVETAIDGQEASDLLEEGRFDLVVTDLAMPRKDGLELVREVRRSSSMPILVLTVRGEEREKVRLLDAGADDYVTKPFGVEELLARARALLRRLETRAEESALDSWGDVEVDRDRRTVRKKGTPVHLTPTEFSLLTTLLPSPAPCGLIGSFLPQSGERRPGSPTTHCESTWEACAQARGRPNRPRWILTEPWVGYRFTHEP